ncbi:hypothetical protein ACHAW5_010566 [Stephanodiscus triporus]|uniref:Uncharacterized protein n=1 Tax=Stephanodiscus triporus TaxID=2934178 RepID=A0ABD3PLX2_9STRA
MSTLILEPFAMNSLLLDRLDGGSSSKLSDSEDSIWRSRSSSSDYNSLPEVPSFSPVERTRAVVDCSDPREVVARVARCLQKLSIVANFDSERAYFFAETVDRAKFYIRLYKCDGARISVEVQRLDGHHAVSLVEYARAIVAAARGGEVDEGMLLAKKSSSLNYIPAYTDDVVCAEYLTHTAELLRSHRSDAVLLGVESLLLLTDRDRSQVSPHAAEAVLRGRGNTVIKDFIHKCLRGPPAASSDGEDDFDRRQGEIMRNFALAVLGNSLQTASDVKCPMLSSLVRSDEWMERSSGLVDVLLRELSEARDRCHGAYHAARCLNVLLDSSPAMKRTLIERELIGMMKKSRAVGRKRHSLLAKECDAALALMADV